MAAVPWPAVPPLARPGTKALSKVAGHSAALRRLCLAAGLTGSQPTPHTGPFPGAPASGILIDHADNQSPGRNLRGCPITVAEKGMRAVPSRPAGSVAPRLRKSERGGGGAGERGRDCRRDGGGGCEGVNRFREGSGPLRNRLSALPRCAQPLPLPAGGPAPSRHCSRHRDRAARHGAEAGPGGAALAVPPAPRRPSPAAAGGAGPRRVSPCRAPPRGVAASAPFQVRSRGAARRPSRLPLRARGRGFPRDAQAASTGCGPRAPAAESPAPARPQRLLCGSRVAVSHPAGEGVSRVRELRGPRPAPRGCAGSRGDPGCGVGVGGSGGARSSSHRRPGLYAELKFIGTRSFFVPPTCCKKANGTDIYVL